MDITRDNLFQQHTRRQCAACIIINGALSNVTISSMYVIKSPTTAGLCSFGPTAPERARKNPDC